MYQIPAPRSCRHSVCIYQTPTLTYILDPLVMQVLRLDHHPRVAGLCDHLVLVHVPLL
jgi:hypothetical protein